MRILGVISLTVALGFGFVGGSALAQRIQNQQISSAGNVDAIVSETDSSLLVRSIATFVDKLKPDDIPNAVHAFELSQGPGKIQALSVLVSMWADFDPRGAISEARKPGDRVTTETIISSVYSALTRRNLENAVLEVKQMPLGGVIVNRAIDDMPSPDTALSHTQQFLAEKRVTAMIAVVRTETEIDPGKALQVALEFRTDYLWDDGLYIVFDRWAQKNLEEATQALLKLSPGLRMEFARSIVNSLVWKDPQTAIAWAGQLPEGQMRSTAVQYVVTQWAQKDPEAAFKYAQTLPLLRDRDFILGQIINEWSMNDPKSAVEFIDQLPETLQRTAMLQAALTAWALGDFKAAFPRIQKISSTKEKNKILNQVIGAWTVADPESAFAWVQSLSSFERGPAWSDALTSLARSNPALAAEWYDKVPDYPRKSDAIQNIVFSWQQKDPEAAWIWVRKLPDSELKNQLSSGILGPLAFVDLKAAMAHLEALPTGTFKDACIEAMVSSMVNVDVKSALQLLETATPSSSRDDCLLGLCGPLSQIDPKFATIYGEAYPWHGGTRGDGNQVSSFSPKAQREEFLKYVVPAWFQQNPSGAASWLEALPDDDVKQLLLVYSARSWASMDIDAAAAYALNFPPGSLRSDFIENVVEVMADNDPAKAVEWAKQLKAPSEAKSVQKNVIEYLAQSDPQIAVRYVSSLADDSSKLQIMENIAPDWATKDPSTAARWVSTFPESDQKATTLSLVAQRWVDLDPDAAGKWLDQLPQASSRDAAVYGYSHRIYENDHAKIAVAYQWAQKIADTTRRQSLVADLFEQWMIIDSTTAEAVIAKSTLPGDVKAKILKR